MTRFLLGLMALGLFGATPQASAACRWFGTQLQCDLGGNQVLIRTQQVAQPPYAGALRTHPLLENGQRLAASALPERPLLGRDPQNIRDCPRFPQNWGNE